MGEPSIKKRKQSYFLKLRIDRLKKLQHDLQDRLVASSDPPPP
jgi:hypothetical protein